ncbi:MAG: DUF2490 domain-containing protein [Bacteroidales bacterium]|nr:DUF2490 domain-containing protein [Bacteroidales bacterium]
MTLFRKFLFFLLLIFLVSQSGNTQSTGEWFTEGVHFDLPRKFSLKVSSSQRFLNTGIGMYKFLFEVEGGYKINKHFDVALIYRAAWRLADNGGYYYRNKLMADFNADQSFGRFKVANRLRYQRKTKTYINDALDVVPLQHLRNKCKVAYDIRKSKFTPDIFCEMFFPLYAFKNRNVDEIRLGADLGYKISKKHTVKGGVMVQNGVMGLPIQSVWFRFGYTFTWKI